METIDTPCDFDVFVAERHSIDRESAQELIRVWLAGYVPIAKVPETLARFVMAGVADAAVCKGEDQPPQEARGQASQCG